MLSHPDRRLPNRFRSSGSRPAGASENRGRNLAGRAPGQSAQKREEGGNPPDSAGAAQDGRLDHHKEKKGRKRRRRRRGGQKPAGDMPAPKPPKSQRDENPEKPDAAAAASPQAPARTQETACPCRPAKRCSGPGGSGKPARAATIPRQVAHGRLHPPPARSSRAASRSRFYAALDLGTNNCRLLSPRRRGRASSASSTPFRASCASARACRAPAGCPTRRWTAPSRR
jgi:exopolyphosphatase/guanosine-5'-triphosphate,3'-diphosphate pyrophosphatase